MKQPLGIRILRWFAALASAGMFVSIALAILDIGPHLMGGEKVTRLEWLHIAAPLVAVIGCLMASIAYGFATRKAWSRHLVMAIFVLIIVYASAIGALNVLRNTIMWRAIVNASLFGCASAWYFYFKTSLSISANSEGDRFGDARIFLGVSYCTVETGVRNAEA